MSLVQINERSWGIDLISSVNEYLQNKDLIIKRAGGEHSLKSAYNTMFPDVLLFADNESGKVLIGWELKMPDTDIEDVDLIDNAYKKAKSLNLNCFLVWNVNQAVLYRIDDDGNKEVIHEWIASKEFTCRNDVHENRDIWRALLHDILLDLNEYLVKGIIKSRSLVESVSSDSLLAIIFRNKSLLSENYKILMSRDAEFEDNLKLWWTDIKREYPEKTNKFDILAEINILSWIYKFIFANLIKKFFITATQIEEITYDTTPLGALNIIGNISQNCDFWNIFKRQLGNEHVPEILWKELVDFNYFLIDSNIEHIEQENWQNIFELLINEKHRKLYGQYSTPVNLAKLLVHLTCEDKTKTIFDPCCGTGTIIKEAYNLKKQYKQSPENISNTIWANDKNAFPLQLTTLALFDADDMGKVLNIFQKDISFVNIGETIKLSDPFTGDLIEKTINPFDYIVSNLPFVQGQDIPKDNLQILSIKEFISLHTGEKLSTKSDLSFYIPFKLWSLLADGGKIGIVLSNSWLGTDAGISFKNILQKFFQIEKVVTSANGRWFKNAKIVTNLLILKKRNTPIMSVSPQETVCFTTINKKIEDLDLEDDIPFIRPNNCSQNEVANKTTYTQEEIKIFENMGVQWSGLFTDLKWLPEIKDKLIPLNSKFHVSRGERRGKNELFYPDENTTIENAFLRPMLMSSSDIKCLIAKPSGKAFCCDKSLDELKKSYPKAYAHITEFADKKNGTGVLLPKSLARTGMHWYQMNDSFSGELITGLNFYDRLFFAKCDMPIFLDQRLIRLNRKNSADNLDVSFALLNSLFGLFYIELLGFGRGEGVLDINATKIKTSYFMLNSDLLSIEEKNGILERFQPLLQRDILTLSEELADAKRNDFDDYILQVFNLLEYKEKIKSSLMNLYKIRKSVKL